MHRRRFLQTGLISTTVSCSGWLSRLAANTPEQSKRNKSMILIWLNGGPATIDLWDVKEGHPNGGPVKSIRTNAEGLRISEYLPELAKVGRDFSLIRSMSTREGDHGRATYLMRTGNLPLGNLAYPSLGAIVSKELGDPKLELPNFVSITPQRFFNSDAYGPGFLGSLYAPLIVGEGRGEQSDFRQIDDALKVQNIKRHPDLTEQRFADRLELLRLAQESFTQARPGPLPESHATAYDRATRLMSDQSDQLFDLSKVAETERKRYGQHVFGQGCLLARRLIEQGVSFVEVNYGFWDTHNDNFRTVKELSTRLDHGLAALLTDLKERGLLDSTLVLCMGEFGRTPRINGQTGRDHYPNAWATLIAGGGVQGGRVVGKTSADGTRVEGEPTSTMDLIATVCHALGIDGEKQNMSNLGRPIRIVDQDAAPVLELFTS